MGSAETPATTRRIDPAADLREATERNAQEKRNEEEALRLEKAEADRAEASAKKKLAEAEAAAAVKQQAEEAARRQAALLVTLLNSAPPPEFTGQTRGAGGENLVEEREGGEPSTPGANVLPPPPPPSEGVQGKQPADPPVPPTEDEAVARLLLQVGSPTRRRLEKATSAPRPLEVGTASSAAPDAEATSAAPVGWVLGGGTGPLNRALLDVQAKLRAEGDALQSCTKAFLAFLASRAAVRVCFFLWSFVFLVPL